MNLQPIRLPTRYERLKAKADEVKADLSRVVVKVEAGVEHVQSVFHAMQQSELCQFEVIFGDSGSGKTTFLETLEQFFEDIHVQKIENDGPLEISFQKIKDVANRHPAARVVAYLADRDNPTESDDEILTFFERLRGLFRQIDPTMLVVWPLSLREKADHLFTLAERIGADSLVGRSRGPYIFCGPPADQFYRIADDTARMFNEGAGLLEYGIDEELGRSVLMQADTLGKYFRRVIDHSNALNSVVEEILKEKPRTRVWIVVGGDEATELMSTVQGLTYGNQRQLDVARFTASLGQRRELAQYLKDWKGLGGYMTYLLRALDVRVIEMPPQLALAAFRSCGGDDIKRALKQKSASFRGAIDQAKDCMLGELITNSDPRDRRSPHKTAKATRAEYQRVQQLAKRSDKLMNHCVAKVIGAVLKDAGIEGSAVAEKQAVFGTLIPDVVVSIPNQDPICLEFTWRTTGEPAEEDLPLQQNTLTQGHIQQYVFEKAYEYVKALDLAKLAHEQRKD